MAKKFDLNGKAKEILELAEKQGVQKNFFFITTFQTYIEQTNILNDLEKAIKENESMCTKSYVRGKENLYVNPAIKEYNKAATARNQTMKTILSIMDNLNDGGADHDELAEFINGRAEI